MRVSQGIVFGKGPRADIKRPRRSRKTVTSFSTSVPIVRISEHASLIYFLILTSQIDVKIFSVPDEIFPLMQKVISSYPDYATTLAPRLILGLWHPLFIEPARRHLPTLTRYHIGLSMHIARKYFWDHMDGFSMAFPMLTSAEGQRFIRDCKAAGKGLMTWTVNEKRDMRMAKKWGIDWLITDRVGFSVDARNEVSVREQQSGESLRAADRLFEPQQWEQNPSVVDMSMYEHFKWSWLNWKHYSVPQASPFVVSRSASSFP